jgi:hypothetical protein
LRYLASFSRIFRLGSRSLIRSSALSVPHEKANDVLLLLRMSVQGVLHSAPILSFAAAEEFDGQVESKRRGEGRKGNDGVAGDLTSIEDFLLRDLTAGGRE